MKQILLDSLSKIETGFFFALKTLVILHNIKQSVKFPSLKKQ